MNKMRHTLSGGQEENTLLAKEASVHSDVMPSDVPMPQGPPLLPVAQIKRLGRPKGSKNRPKGLQADKIKFVPPSVPAPLGPKLERTFKRMVTDATALIAPVSEDGGGTLETAPSVTRESLERRVSRRLNVLDRYLTDQRLHELLLASGLKEIGIYEGIMMDKLMVTKGQPNVIIGTAERTKLSEVLPALLTEMRRRNMITTVSERKIQFQGGIDEGKK